MRRHLSLANRLSLYILPATVLIFGAIATMFWHYGIRRQERLVADFANLTMQGSVERLDGKFSRVVKMLEVTSSDVAMAIHDSVRIKEIIWKLATEDSLIMASCVAISPELLSANSDTLSMDYVYRDMHGNYRYKHLGDSTYNYTRMRWYSDAVRAGEGLWSEPYFDKGAGNVMMTTYSYPVKDREGRIIAVLTADVPLSIIKQETERLRPIDDCWSFVLSREGVYIVHPDSSIVIKEDIFRRSQEIDSPELSEIGKEMTEGQIGVRHITFRGHELLMVYEQITGTGWSICSVCSYGTMLSRLGLATFWAVAMIIVGLIALVLIIRIILMYSMRPLRRLTEAADNIASGDLNAELPDMEGGDEISRLNNSFAAMQASLRLQMQQLVATTSAKERIESELHIARSIQMSLVPRTFPPFPECDRFELHAMLRPAKEVGGDLYDFFIRDSKLFFTIGDVSGKGVPASLFMAVTRTVFRITAADCDSPARILSLINDSLVKDNDAGMFVTMFVGVFDLTSGKLTFCNAGHNPAVIISSEGAKFLDAAENLAVGVIDGFEYEEQSVMLDKGDIFFLYTDGLTEAEDSAKSMFGERRMLDVISSCGRLSPEESIALMDAAVTEFVGDTEQSDDLTMLCLKIN